MTPCTRWSSATPTSSGANAVSSFRIGINNADIQKPWIHFFDAQEMGVRTSPT